MEKIQMPCTEEQFNRDLKPFLVDAGVDLKQCYKFDTNPFLLINYNKSNIVGTWSKDGNYKTIDYKPKEFLKHLGIDIYDVGDVVQIGEYECEVKNGELGFFLEAKNLKNSLILNQFNLQEIDLKNSKQDGSGKFPFHATIYDLNKTIQFLKSHENKMEEKEFYNIGDKFIFNGFEVILKKIGRFYKLYGKDKNDSNIDFLFEFKENPETLKVTNELIKKYNQMQEKPFTIEQAQQMLAIESLKELVYKFYPELKSPVNVIDDVFLEKLSQGMFGDPDILQVSENSAIKLNRHDLIGKSIYVSKKFEVVLHKIEIGGTLIEFKNK